MFGVNSNCRIRDITDGTSNSVAVAETTLEIKFQNPSAWSTAGWSTMGVNFQDTKVGINQYRCCRWDGFVQNGSTIGRNGSAGWPGSAHIGGIHILLGDGSVRFVTENLDSITRINLARIGDNQVIGEF